MWLHRAKKLFPLVVHWLGAGLTFLAALYYQAAIGNLWQMALLAAPALALMLAFAGLLYNRARAWPNGPMQRRALFAAEHALQAALTFFIGCLVSALVFALSYLVGGSPIGLRPIDVLVAMSTPILFVLLSFWRFFTAFLFARRHVSILRDPRHFVRAMRNEP